ncbi:4-alpha-glucanotransferase [Phytohalomonas tamaricis]|uniref:4-alpha-glucanotransferase n=1 Tax=Phytohalomonas tamaricis TaxID=2081032 RepID=UPI000D0B9990|nr:4-alpha-glucanotransferase [Phytohalomonas tamaricis]
MSDDRLTQLAEMAGIMIDWQDANGDDQHVPPQAMRDVLDALGYPAATDEQIEESIARLERLNAPASIADLPPLLTADINVPLLLPCRLEQRTPFTLIREDGRRVEGHIDTNGKLPAIDTPGYHQLTVAETTLTLAVAPERCFSIAEALTSDKRERDTARVWGLAAQIYALHRPGDGGIGDTAALETFVRAAARHGAHALTISPVHAMFTSDVERFSPYSPSSRLWRNGLHAAPEQILGESAVDKAITRLGLGDERKRLETLDLIDWPQAARNKLTLLRALYEDFYGSNGSQSDSEAMADFAEFRHHGGEALEDHCRFETLCAVQGTTDWRQWPQALQDPRSEEVNRFALEHAYDVGFHAFLQWLIARGLELAQRGAREAGMAVGLVNDLAVGADAAGSQAWSRKSEMLSELSVGAPPDAFNARGQLWGVAGFSPQGLKRHGFRAFIEMLRAGFQGAGGMRIDHAMGLSRLWLVPNGAKATEGAYVRYPLDDLLRLVALESHRHRAIVIGEDLGTVEPGFRDKLDARGVLGMRVMWFEREEDEFTPAEEYAAEAMAMTSTHDLPTVAGWWTGRDIAWRARLDMIDENESEAALYQARQDEREQLAELLHVAATENVDDVLIAAARHIGRTPSMLAILPVEDALGLVEQANLPGTINEHPNWRRRWPGTAETLLDQPDVSARLNVLNRARLDDTP